jgi:hypothetical protein
MNAVKKFFIAFFGGVVLSAFSAGAVVNIFVTFDPAQAGAEIPADFCGLSFEMQRVLPDTNGWHFFSAENTNLIATFQTLGVKNLRVGGNTADRPTLPVPSRGDVDALFAFAKAAEVKVIFTLRLNHGEPADAAALAKYISQNYPGQLDALAIGNEPNVFSTNYETYLAAWKQFAAVISSNVPGVKFCGPGVSPGHEKWSARFAEDLAGGGQIKFISQHDYPGGDARKFATNAAGARERLLSPALYDNYTKFAANFVPVVQSNGLAYRFEEANSFYDGGAADASDTFASALWALDFDWWWAAHGIRGVNFHTGDKVAARDENKPCRYATFWTAADGYNVHPIGYAEKMFSLGSHGKIVPVKVELTQTIPAQTETNFNLAAYAVLGDDKSLYVTLINKSHGGTAGDLSVLLGVKGVDGYSQGKIIRLTAPNGDVTAKTGVMLGGAEISDDAQWNGRWEAQLVPRQRFQFALEVELPAASAAVVRLTAK